MPVFSCGGMRYQQRWQDIPLSEVTAENQANLEATIRRSVSVGINHIETARGYGSSERQLGLVLPTFPRHEIIVQTKLSPVETSDDFRKFLHESLDRLQLDHVDLLSLHGINNEETYEWSVRPGGCLEVARQLQAEGLARHIGLATHGSPELIMRIVQTDAHGGFDYINLHWYYIYQRNWPAILEASRRDMGVFIISPSDKGGMLYAPSEKLEQLTAPLHPIVFNDLFCLSRPEVHTLSIGAARPTDFDRHLEALPLLGQGGALVPPIVARLDQTVRETMGSDFPEKFLQGLPRWEDTPANINIGIILWLLSLAKSYDMVEYGRMRYGLLGNGGHWFPGLNAEKLDEVNLEPELKDSPFRDRIPALLAEAHQLLWRAPVQRLSAS